MLAGFAGGWPSGFYVSGMVGIVAFLIFLPVTKSSPADSSFVSAEELATIRAGQAEEEDPSAVKTRPPVPWRALLSSPPVLAYITNRASSGLATYVNQTKIPYYMGSVLHINPTHIGLILASMNIISVVSLMFCGYFSERIIQWGWLSRTNCRKAFTTFDNVGRCVPMMLIPVVGCNVEAFVALKVFEAICVGGGAGGDGPVPSELTNYFPATIFGIANTLTTSFGFIAPSFAGFILESEWSDDIFTLWTYIFWTAATLSGLGGVVFAFFGAAEVQSFDYIDAPNVTYDCDTKVVAIEQTLGGNLNGSSRPRSRSIYTCFNYRM